MIGMMTTIAGSMRVVRIAEQVGVDAFSERITGEARQWCRSRSASSTLTFRNEQELKEIKRRSSIDRGSTSRIGAVTCKVSSVEREKISLDNDASSQVLKAVRMIPKTGRE